MNTTYTFETLQKEFAPLITQIQSRMTEKRFSHTLAVAAQTFRLSKEFALTDRDTKRLYVAALLHDVTKALSTQEHITLAREIELPLSDEDLASPPVLHALTGAAVAKTEFARYTDDDICEAIRCHTVGKADMSLIDKLLFLADYIEETRTHPICIKTRSDFYRDLASGHNKEETLDRFIVLICRNTASHVASQGRAVHSHTMKTIEALSKKG